MEFRYNDLGHRQDEELSRILTEHSQTKAAEKEKSPTPPTQKQEGSAFERLQNSPLDEVQHIIKSKTKSGSAVLAEYEVREQLAGIKQSEQALLDLFLEK
jgi:hypothetical protein